MIPEPSVPRPRRRRIVVVAILLALLIAAGGIAVAVRSAPRAPARPDAAGLPAAPACDARYREVARIGRSTSRIELSAASGRAAYFTGVSPEYFTATVNARPRAGRVDAGGRITWFEFDHPEDGFQTRTASSPAAVGATEGWFIVDAGGRFTGESALWQAQGPRVSRPTIGVSIRSVGMSLIASRSGHTWSVGGGAGGWVARREGDRWVRVAADIDRFQRFQQIAIDRVGGLYAMLQVEDAARMPTGSVKDAILFVKDALWRFDGTRWVQMPMPDGRISTIEGGDAGVLWAVRYQPSLEILRFENGRWSTVASLEDGKTAASVRLSSDAKGRLFVADYVSPPKGATPASGGESRLWLLTEKGLTRQTLPAAVAQTAISAFAATDDGTQWFVAGATVYRGTCAML